MSGRQVVATSVGGCLWILAGVQFAIAQVVAAEAWNPPCSWTNNYISDLGNTACGMFAVPHGSPAYVCSPLAPLMNASFIASGVLVIAGALLLSGSWPRRRMVSVALVLWVIAGLGKIGVGLVPENTNVGLHLLAALNIPVESIAILLVSLAIVRSDRQLGLLGIGMAVLGLAGMVLGTAGEIAGPALYLGLGVGGMERVAEYPATIWRLAAGIAALCSVTVVLRRTPPTSLVRRLTASRP
jgi:hypothetical membrane protein